MALDINEITQLVKLAVDTNVQKLQIGDIVIIPTPKTVTREQKMAPLPTGKNGKELTPRELEDVTLFGPFGVLTEDILDGK